MEKKKKTILLLFGGTSGEHKVSCQSAASILQYLDYDKYDIYKIGITREGQWIDTNSNWEQIANGTWQNGLGNREAYICPNRLVHGIRTLTGKDIHIDCVIPMLHGKDGEDGSMQGLLEVAGIPYVGSGVLASAKAMDKDMTKKCLGYTEIKQAKYYCIHRNDFATRPDQVMTVIGDLFGEKYPLFVKPAHGGSSLGISKAKNQFELLEGIQRAAEIDDKILIEETIIGREIEVAVLGNYRAHASCIGEILSGNEYYDYEAKYENKGSVTKIVDDLADTKELEIKEAALEVYKAIGCKGLARVDFFLTPKREVIFNEINTMPGFTEISMYPKLWEHMGMGYAELLDKLIELALEER